MSPTGIPASNMKEGDKLPDLEKQLPDLDDEEDLQQTEETTQTDDTKSTEETPDTSRETKKEDKPADTKAGKDGDKKDSALDFKDFNDAKEGIFKKKKEEPKDDKTTDDNKVDDTGRDYSGLSETEIPLFKKMGNAAFAYVKPLVMEQKQLKETNTQLQKQVEDLKVGKVYYPDSIYEHDRAYLLTPEFDRINNDKLTAEAVLSHWQHQAVLIRKGKDWQDIEDDGKGNMRLLPPKPATDDDETEVNNNIAFAQRQLVKTEKVFDDFTTGFKGRHSSDVKTLKDAEAQYFPDYDKPDHITATVQKETMEGLPPSFRKSPLAPLVCKLVGAVRLWQHKYNQVTKEKDKTEKVKELEKKNGPKEGETLGTGTKPAKTPVSFAAFNAAKE